MTCTLCPKNCRADRTIGERGFCGQTDELVLARAALHMWEEPCISGERGSGTVFFCGCSLRCIFCQNYDIARSNVGKRVSVHRLSEIFLELQQKGAHNINLVTPTHYADKIMAALTEARAAGLRLPVVYNTSGYETPEMVEKLRDYVDIWLTDFKYASDELAAAFSHAPDYFERADKALEKMVTQVEEELSEAGIGGTADFDEDGMMLKGIIVRHLVLPGHTDDSKKVIKHLYEKYGDKVYISIMNQYTPPEPGSERYAKCSSYPELLRPLSQAEYDEVTDYAADLGVENGFIQEDGTAEESFIPDFTAYEGL